MLTRIVTAALSTVALSTAALSIIAGPLTTGAPAEAARHAPPAGAVTSSLVAPDRAAGSTEPAMWVRPATGLRAGDRVRVTARGLPPDTPVGVGLCALVPSADEPCSTTLAEATTDRHGRLAVRVPVVDVIYYRPDRAVHPQPVYCRGDGCQMYVWWYDDLGDVWSVGSSALEFTGSPGTIEATPASGLTDGQRVTVTGTADGSDARRVQVWQHSCFTRLGERYCVSEQLAVVPLRRDDTFRADVRVRRFLGAGEDRYDCVDEERFCHLSAAFLDPRTGLPDPGFGDPAYGHPRADIGFAAS
jgi:hypothetical protein